MQRASLVSYLGLDAISLLTLYKAQIRPCLEYGSHLWRGASKHSFATLNAIQKRAIKLIGDPALTNSLDSLTHRRTISALSLYYRYYHGVCSVELKSIILPKALFSRTTRFSNAQHPFAVKLDKNRTSAFANSFIPMTSRDWNSLPATVFPATYNLQLFKPCIHRHLQPLPSPQHSPLLLLFTMEGPTQAFRGSSFPVCLLTSIS